MGRALLVIDMQNGFCDSDGSFARMGRDVSRFNKPIEALERVIGEARRAALPIFYTVHQYRSGYPEAGLQMDSIHPELAVVSGLVEGSWDAEIVSALSPREEDIVVSKSRYDAFLHTDLEMLLRRQNVQELYVGGVSTNVCVESTVRSAAQRDFHVTVVEECVAATSDELHENALKSMQYAFAKIQSMHQVALLLQT